MKELESLIQFWKDSLAEHRLLMSSSTVYLVERTIKTLEMIKIMESAGLFVAKLNNSDWMAGKASYIYQLNITQDHYTDANLVIRKSLSDAISHTREKLLESK